MNMNDIKRSQAKQIMSVAKVIRSKHDRDTAAKERELERRRLIQLAEAARPAETQVDGGYSASQ